MSIHAPSVQTLAAVMVVFLAGGPRLFSQDEAGVPPEAWRLIESAEAMLDDSQLTVASRTDDAIIGVGELAYNGTRVAFSSSQVAESLVQVRVEWGDVTLEAEADLAAGVRVVDGHDHALDLDERLALSALSLQLEVFFNPYDNVLAPHEDSLYRAVSFWADAPVGWPLRRIAVGETPIGEPEPALDDAEGPLDSQGNCGTGGENLLDCADGCRDDDDGRTPLANPCCCNTYSLWHDRHTAPLICRGHDFCRERVPGGCNIEAGCLGRCTGQCGAFRGRGSYTLDCAEHDRCCRLHGACYSPDSIACGDEYEDASDDVLNPLPPTCQDGCYSCCSNAQCDDGNVCTTDRCTDGECFHDPNQNACNDGNPCTDNDRCSNRACRGTPINCDDGAFCNGVESCANGECVPGTDPCPSRACCEEADRCGACNDDCNDAFGPLAVPSVTPGTTAGAGVDDAFPSCEDGSPIAAPGVWYKVMGAGGPLRADTCAGAEFDTRLSVFSGACDSPVCEVGNNDACENRSSATWFADDGVEYVILVHGAAEQSGEFDLSVGAGEPCTGLEKLRRTSCFQKNGRNKVRSGLAQAVPGTELEFLLDGRKARRVTVSNVGIASVKWNRVESGPHAVSVGLPCGGPPLEKPVSCP